MKSLVLLITLAFSLQSFANEDTILTSPNKGSSGCNLKSRHITKSYFLEYFDKLRDAALTNDAKAMSELMHYPLRVNDKKHYFVKDKEEFIQKYESIISSELKNVIITQELNNFFCRDIGIMLGHGSFWIEQKEKLGVYVINTIRKK